MSSKILFNYDLCISVSLIKFNDLVNGISNDYTKYLDLYKEELIKLKVDPQNYQQFDSRLRTSVFEKKLPTINKYYKNWIFK